MSEVPPHAEASEEAIIASILADPDSYFPKAIEEGIELKMFHIAKFRTLFRKISEWRGQGIPIELSLTIQKLTDSGDIERLGGRAGICEMWGAVSLGRFSFDRHAEILRQQYAKRLLWSKSEEIRAAAINSETADDALKIISETSEEIRLSLHAESVMVTAEAAFKEFSKTYDECIKSDDLPGNETGINCLDLIGGGMKPGEFWIIAGPTSGGKSVLSFQMAQSLLKKKEHVLVFTLEMSVSEVFQRLISNMCDVRMQALTKPKQYPLEDGEKSRIRAFKKDLGDWNLKVCDKSGMTSEWICAQCELYAESHDISMVIIDYIQLVEGYYVKGQSREQEIAKMSREFKQLAKKINATVITPSQLNDEGRLRESRAIGHDADVVLKITKEDVKVNKYRNSSKGQELGLELDGEFQRFIPKGLTPQKNEH